jgi:hypothetical protein
MLLVAYRVQGGVDLSEPLLVLGDLLLRHQLAILWGGEIGRSASLVGPIVSRTTYRARPMV